MNIDQAELDKFDKIAYRWWDTEGEFKPLHDINPLRMQYIQQFAELNNKLVLDVGCGGGILTEALVMAGAKVTGIDMSPSPLEVAKLHLLESGLEADYKQQTVEDTAQQQPEYYDVITCMEMLEHVPNPQSIIQACANLLKPNGLLFLSTLNRNPKSYLLAIVGAEYLLQLLPKGTHDYQQFIRPSELVSWTRGTDLEVFDITGMSYHPLTQHYTLGKDIDVNYLMALQKHGE